MTNSLIIHATSFAGYVILDNDDIVETIEASSHALGVRISFCTITQAILDEVNKNGFCPLKDDRQPDLFNNL